jgi:membrane protease YdiL (CAAX protease family)
MRMLILCLCSVPTVRNYASNIFTKLHIVDGLQAIARAREAGLGRLGRTAVTVLSKPVPIVAERAAGVGAADASPLRSWIGRHPIATFLVLVYATTAALVFVPNGLTEPGLLPGAATPHGIWENVLGSAVPAFLVTALVSGKAGVWDLARRSFAWRVPLRWVSDQPARSAADLVDRHHDPLWSGAAARSRPELVAASYRVPAGIGDLILLNNVAEEIGWTGFVFARFQDRHGPLRAALLTTVFFWLFHVPSFYVETRSWATTALALGIFLLPHLGSRVITGWLYNSAGSSVLIAGLFHSMRNAIVNSTGLVAVVSLPQFEVLVIMAGIVVLAAAVIAVATRGRLGLKRSSGLSSAT